VWALEFSHAAVKALMHMPPDEARRIRQRLDELARDPWAAPGVKKLTDHPGFRLRVGNWRVVYLLRKERLTVQVIRVARREEVYR
jgi:mRNA interferase RelE/StbE